MTRIRFRDLTVAQKRFICNGCGGKGSIVPVPNFRFGASCNHHDFQYWLGCTEAQRKKADKQFLVEMLKDARKVLLERLIQAKNAKPPKRFAFIFNYFGIHTKIYTAWALHTKIYIVWAYVYYFAVRYWGWNYFGYRYTQKTLEDLEVEMECDAI